MKLSRRPLAAQAQGPRRALRLTPLEDRLTPAVSFQFDYSLDTSGFFNDPAHRAALEQAAADLTSPLASTPAAITPGGNNTWQAVFNNPSTGAQTQLANLAVPAGTLEVFVGGRNATGSEAGEGGPGGYSVSGAKAFQQTVASRGLSGFGPWGGSLTIDTNQNWYFGSDPAGLQNGQIDFRTVATHELGHVLGFGTAPQFDAQVQNGKFTGAATTAAYGSAPSVSPDLSHFAQGTKSGSDPVSMQPTLEANRRVGFSNLDYAALQDIGWQVGGSSGGTSAAAPATATTTPATTTANPTTTATTPATPTATPTEATQAQAAAKASPAVPTAAAAGKLVVVSGPNDGRVQVYSLGAGGQLTPNGPALQPFGDFRGAVRSATADVNGDGADDIILGTGPYGGSHIRILDGKTFNDLVPEFSAYEDSFTGGVFLAAGDFDKDGRSEVVVTPDQGGGPRVRVFKVGTGSAAVSADFMGINDPTFRGGARTAVGDVNGDGTADLVVAAGYGGGPRVSLLDGSTLLTGSRHNLAPDFFAFEQGLRNGVFVTVGDVNADGKGDLIFGAGPGGGPRVLTLSGAAVVASGGPAALANPLANYFAGDASERGGVRVAAKDGNGDGKAEVVTGSGDGNAVRVYSGGGSPLASIAPFASANDLDGVYVG